MTTVLTAPIARTDNVSKIYGSGATEVRALTDVSVTFARGSFTAVMGPSGSGKSTLMHCLAGLDRPTAGRVFLGETDLSALKEAELTRVRRDRVGFVFQAFNLLPMLTAAQNIALPLELAGKKVAADQLRAVAEQLGIGARLGHRPAELSGGEQQRVAVARALITQPDLIFADEPTGALDSSNSTGLLTQLAQATKTGGHTVIMVTHDPVAASFADRAIFLRDGRVVDDIDHPTTDATLATMRQLGA